MGKGRLQAVCWVRNERRAIVWMERWGSSSLHTLTLTDASFLSLKLLSDYIQKDSLVKEPLEEIGSMRKETRRFYFTCLL